MSTSPQPPGDEPDLPQRAGAGDVQAMRALAASLLATGDPARRAEALGWLERAIARHPGEPDHKRALAEALGAEDPAAAAKWALIAALQDDEAPTLPAGLADDQRAQALQAAKAWLAEHGTIFPGFDAQPDWAVARALYYGLGVAPDRPRAFAMMARLGDAGDPNALGWHGRWLLEGAGEPKDPARGVRLLERAGAAGDAEAYCHLGEAYRDGHGVAQDHAAAKRCFERALSLGAARAYADLGNLYWAGFGVEQDHAEAVRLYRLAHEAGVVAGTDALTEATFYGRGTAIDRDEWLRLNTILAGYGSTRHMQTLAAGLIVGHGMRRDPAEGLYWLRKAEAAGDLTAAVVLAWCALGGYGLERDVDAALAALERAKDDATGGRDVALAVLAATGCGYPRDPAEAARRFALAVERGHFNATIYYGDLLHKGLLPGGPDPARSDELHRQALADLEDWSLVGHGEFWADMPPPIRDLRLALAWSRVAERRVTCPVEHAAAAANVRAYAAQLGPDDVAWAERRAAELLALAPGEAR